MGSCVWDKNLFELFWFFFFGMLIAKHAYKETVLFHCALHLVPQPSTMWMCSCHIDETNLCLLPYSRNTYGGEKHSGMSGLLLYFYIVCDCLHAWYYLQFTVAICGFILKIQVRWCFQLELHEAEHTTAQQWLLHRHDLSFDILSLFSPAKWFVANAGPAALKTLVFNSIPVLPFSCFSHSSTDAWLFLPFPLLCSVSSLPSPWQSCCLIPLFQYSLASSGKVMKRRIRLLSGCSVSS